MECILNNFLQIFLLENALKKTYKWPYRVKPKVYLAWYPILISTMSRFLGWEQEALHGTSSEYSPRLNIFQSQIISWFIWGFLYLLNLWYMEYLEYMGIWSSLPCAYDIRKISASTASFGSKWHQSNVSCIKNISICFEPRATEQSSNYIRKFYLEKKYIMRMIVIHESQRKLRAKLGRSQSALDGTE